VDESIPFDVVGLPRGDGRNDASQIGWAHLIVSSHHDQNLGALSKGCIVATSDGGPHTLVDEVRDQPHARVRMGFDERAGAIGRGIVDDEDVLDPARDPVQGRHDLALYAERGHDHRDFLETVLLEIGSLGGFHLF